VEQPVVSTQRDESGSLLLSQDELDLLKAIARANASGRARINAHASLDADVQEMLIAFVGGSYVRPHRHRRKRESFHVVEGKLDALTFDANGEITNRTALGPYGSGLPFYFRSESNDWHCFLVRSEIAIVHETTQGPFSPGESEFPAWAPDPEDFDGVQAFLTRLSL
jgi:cupin fold WbuC family metalloprotein